MVLMSLISSSPFPFWILLQGSRLGQLQKEIRGDHTEENHNLSSHCVATHKMSLGKAGEMVAFVHSVSKEVDFLICCLQLWERRCWFSKLYFQPFFLPSL
jgi:hypothetical protein